MQFSADWQDADNVAPEESATVADFRLYLSGQNVCLHLRGAHSVDHLTLPLYSLASGLAHDWWLLFGGRDKELSLTRHRVGFALPDVRLSFDGAAFSASTYQRTYANPDVRFWVGPSEVMTRPEAEAQLDGLISDVLARLTERSLPRTSAALRWARVRNSRLDPEEAAFCEAAGALGRDPYAIDPAAAEAIELAARIFDGEPLTEFLAGMGRSDYIKLLDWTEHVRHRGASESRLADLQPAIDEVGRAGPEPPQTAAWRLGYRRARGLRRVLKLAEGVRFRRFESLARSLGASHAFRLAPAVDGIRALAERRQDDCHLHIRSHGKSNEAHASHLFSFARGVGELVCFPDSQIAPVNDLHAAYRQAAGRAFAAEFLAPVNEVLALQADGKDSVSIAEEFAVSSQVVDRQIDNAQRIEAACA